ncbi:gap junction protein delta 6 [Nerophis ophidion]|uniref:gap junction protein delta 6 n=1 Tax=Nerophis ophidion TaxID=159077 RepID=UPI002ADF7FF4|nr:gap junction protein delta 6 [Nerophis ophidion]
MTEWTLLKRLLDAVHQHSTMIGRLWLTVMVIFRLLVVAVATEDVYTDEQEMFVCNTLQPGCATVCYDAFAPISQPRFWVFHIISVSTPSLCFIIYTWHNLSKLPQKTNQTQAPEREDVSGQLGWEVGGQEAFGRSCDSDSCSLSSHKHLGNNLPEVLQAQAVSGGVLSKCYVLHVCLRAVLEVGFVVAQWKLFGFQVPVHILCSTVPCSQPVDCYVSRPTEKTIFLLFMFCVGVFCILLNLLELNHLGWKKIRQAVRMREGASWGRYPGKRGGYQIFPPDTPSLTSSLGYRDVTSTTSLPTLDLVMGHQADCTCGVDFGRMRKEEVVREFGLEQPKKHKRESKKEKRPSKQRSAEIWI